MKYCNNCGNQLNDAVKFCPVCGSKQPDVSSDRDHIEAIQTVEKPKNKKKKIILISSIIGAAVVMILAGVICLMFLFGNKESNPETTTTEATTTEETTTEKPTTEEPTTEDPIELENIAAIEAYHGMISGLVTDAVSYSDDSISVVDEREPYQYLIYYDYSIEDFDSDGVSELMVYTETNASPEGDSEIFGSGFDFYEYDEETDSATLIHDACGEYNGDDDSMIFYDNGVIELTSDERESSDEGGSFICVNTNIFDIMGIDDIEELEEQNGCEMYEEPDMFKISIFKGDDGIYYMYFSSVFSVDYIYELSEEEAKEYLDNLRDAGIIDAEVNDFALEELADVCGFDYDEAVAQIEENTPPIDYDAMYGDIIYKYKELVDGGSDYSQITNEEYPYEIDCDSDDRYSVTIGETSGEIGYLISDLDGDGISELVIGVCDDTLVIDVYTIRDGSVVRILDSGERYKSFYCGDGVFYTEGSGGAANHICELYQIISGHTTLLETVYTEPDEDDYNTTIYYYSTENAYETEKATEISEDEYLDKINEFESKCCNLTGLTPLSEY